MKKEKNILATIEIHMSTKYDAIPIRLNSGMAYQGSKLKTKEHGLVLSNLRHVKLCPTGTADLMALLPSGVTVFIETKTAVGTQSNEQKKWEAAVKQRGHIYIVARSTEQVTKELEDKLNDNSNRKA